MSEKEVNLKLEEYKQITINPSDHELDKMIRMNQEIVKSLEKDRENIIKNKEQIIKNNNLQRQASALKLQQQDIKGELKDVIENITHLSFEIGACEVALENIKKLQDEYKKLQKECEIYSYFAEVMSKDGISRTIIAENINIINKEIEKILLETGFTVGLESSENGKAVEIYFKAEKTKKRLVEAISGMEKTFSALAIRAALINVSTLPRPNIFVLDEALEQLDSEWKDVIVKVLENLKRYFELIIIITHDDSLKDIVDNVVEIDRDDQGYAKLCD
jgi:DNA repair exonuclease SbcCD ATPase subunit